MGFIEGLQTDLGQRSRVARKADAVLHGSRGAGRGCNYGSCHCRLGDLILRHDGF
jgi:hypothetical protein